MDRGFGALCWISYWFGASKVDELTLIQLYCQTSYLTIKSFIHPVCSLFCAADKGLQRDLQLLFPKQKMSFRVYWITRHHQHSSISNWTNNFFKTGALIGRPTSVYESNSNESYKESRTPLTINKKGSEEEEEIRPNLGEMHVSYNASPESSHRWHIPTSPQMSTAVDESLSARDALVTDWPPMHLVHHNAEAELAMIIIQTFLATENITSWASYLQSKLRVISPTWGQLALNKMLFCLFHF